MSLRELLDELPFRSELRCALLHKIPFFYDGTPALVTLRLCLCLNNFFLAFRKASPGWYDFLLHGRPGWLSCWCGQSLIPFSFYNIWTYWHKRSLILPAEIAVSLHDAPSGPKFFSNQLILFFWVAHTLYFDFYVEYF